jgi:hypothetical protein
MGLCTVGVILKKQEGQNEGVESGIRHAHKFMNYFVIAHKTVRQQLFIIGASCKIVCHPRMILSEIWFLLE